MKGNCKVIFLIIVACLCPLTMQAQEVKTSQLETNEEFSEKEPSLDFDRSISRPALGGFPVLQGKSYYSESHAPWMSEDGTPLLISPNAVPKLETPQMGLGKLETYGDVSEVPGLTNRQYGGFMYRQDMGRFAFSPYVGMSKMNTGVYGMGNLTKATFGSTLSYHVNDWLTVGLYGQYVPTNTTDPRSVIMSPFMPKSSYGGFIEVMFNRHWGIGARMGREFAPQKNGKWGWKNTTDIYPIYKK